MFGLRSSPTILGTVIAHHLYKYQSVQSEPIQSIKDSIYVDDLISGGETVEEAFNTYQVAKQALAEGGFYLRKWDSNSKELRDKIATELSQTNQGANAPQYRKEATSHLIGSSNTQGIDQLQTKLLGISYNNHSDSSLFAFPISQPKLVTFQLVAGHC